MGSATIITIVDCGSRKVGAIEQALGRTGLSVMRTGLAELCARSFEGSAGAVISGGPRLFTEEPTLIRRFACLADLAIPVLGICLGHQALGLLHGAEVFLGRERREPEVITFQPGASKHPLTSGLEPRQIFMADHCEGITLPEGFELLASSAHYPVEVMACDERRRYGVQFHPEVSGEAGRALLQSFARLVLESSPP